MNLDHLNGGAKMAGDLVATTGAATVAVSHFAEVFTPIVTLLIALITLAWWVLRFIDRAKGDGE
jgi:hypothetical protein